LIKSGARIGRYMLSIIIIITAIIISLLLTKKYKMSGFVILVALIGSDTDSAGLLYAISSYIPGYKIIIRSLVFLVFFIAVIKLIQMQASNQLSYKFQFWYFYPLLISSAIIFIITFARDKSIIVSMSEIIWLGTPFFFIWFLGSLKNNREKLFVMLIIFQAIITLIILVAGPQTSLINGASYAYIIGGNSWVLDPSLIINANISIGDFNKHSINVFKFGQYHNPNSLGVYSTVMVVTSIYLFLKKENLTLYLPNKLISLFLLMVGIVGWFNSLTRGPILLVGFVLTLFIMSIIVYPKTSKRIFLFLIFITLTALLTESILKMVDFLFVNNNNVSVLSRLDGYMYAFNTIKESPLWGVKPSEYDPIPHVLPLKIASYYGLPAAILITVPFFHITLINTKIFISRIINGISEESLFPLMLNAIILGAMFTNGVVVYVLFWVILAEITTRIKINDR
jgi:hypothetical protein